SAFRAWLGLAAAGPTRSVLERHHVLAEELALLLLELVELLADVRRLRDLIGRHDRADLERDLDAVVEELLADARDLVQGRLERRLRHVAGGEQLAGELVVRSAELCEEAADRLVVRPHDVVDLAALVVGQVAGEEEERQHEAGAVAERRRPTRSVVEREADRDGAGVAALADGGSGLKAAPERLRARVAAADRGDRARDRDRAGCGADDRESSARRSRPHGCTLSCETRVPASRVSPMSGVRSKPSVSRT